MSTKSLNCFVVKSAESSWTSVFSPISHLEMIDVDVSLKLDWIWQIMMTYRTVGVEQSSDAGEMMTCCCATTAGSGGGGFHTFACLTSVGPGLSREDSELKN
ncbi:hypothetical protein GCK72_023639 [Caenorhabditis remanei]|uniref:Uncharacterized protein n=1 Tax=Caenorhabditis remanei TaxID=31234 RepID=A0A6A5FX02_CAERE|nr:hypothetical protein GCK72_023639 [Caenorhabditis remanei]KAF1747178.1 hypothetical protein GCK72_023639 [Caenorhabditis remanei]